MGTQSGPTTWPSLRQIVEDPLDQEMFVASVAPHPAGGEKAVPKKLRTSAVTQSGARPGRERRLLA